MKIAAFNLNNGFSWLARLKYGFCVENLILTAVGCLLALGLVITTSASMEVAHDWYGNALYFFKRHLIYLMLGAVVSVAMLRVPLSALERYGWILLPVSLVLLVAVLIPGLGSQVKGSSRWLRLGPFSLQASELAKLGFIIYLAGYLVRHKEEVRHAWAGFIKPLMLLFCACVLILMEPDLGAVMVMTATSLGMIYISGVRLRQFFAVLSIAVGCGGLLVISEPYRWQRVLAFTDPWADPYNASYQLTQSLIAFGRGQWLGVGLGDSVQKLFYLPEAHTDFIFAILCEELGVLGGLWVASLFLLLVCAAFVVGRSAERLGKFYGAYLSYGVGLLLGMQFLINVGVNVGLLPTKGLTLPFMSYGGTSLILNMTAIALVYRVQMENRFLAGWPRGVAKR